MSLALPLLLASAALAIAAAVGWSLAAVLAPLLTRRSHMPASTRGLLLAETRLLPLACVAILVPAQMSAFARFEGAVSESAGALLLIAAAVGVALTGDAIWSAVRGWRDTAHAVSLWRASATPLLLSPWRQRAWTVRPAFPLVAVAGVFRPELFVSRRVIDACTADELMAIAAHEAAHAAARDNLVRWLFRLTPGARLCRRLADSLENQWAAAAEERADADAVRSASALDLAAALTKVARLAITPEPAPVLASALIGQSDLRARVQRLLETPIRRRGHRAAYLPIAGLAALAIVVQLSPVSHAVHELFEWFVRHH